MSRVEIKKGEIVEKWRNDRRVQRVLLKIDGDLVRDIVQREICRQAIKAGVILPDIGNRNSCDPWLRIFTLNGDGYDDPHICHAELSYYVDAPKEAK